MNQEIIDELLAIKWIKSHVVVSKKYELAAWIRDIERSFIDKNKVDYIKFNEDYDEAFKNITIQHSRFGDCVPEYIKMNNAQRYKIIKILDLVIPKWVGDSNADFLKNMKSEIISETREININKLFE